MSTSAHGEPVEGPDARTAAELDELAAARRRRRLVILLGVPVVAIALLLIWGTVRGGGQPGGGFVNNQGGEVDIGEGLARDFGLTTFDGEAITLSGLRGKVVMVDFWASWCPPCRTESATLARVYRSFEDRPVEFVGVNVWETRDGDGRDFVLSEGITYPNGADKNGRITIDYGVFGLPEKFFIDRDGRIVRKYIGPIRADELTRILEEILAES